MAHPRPRTQGRTRRRASVGVSSALLAAALVLSSCGVGHEVETRTNVVVAPEIELPSFTPATPALRLRLGSAVKDGTVAAIERMPGVVVAAPMTIDRVEVSYRGRNTDVRVVSVEPLAFRSVAPAATQDADFVWTSLIGGRAVVSPETARSLDFEAPGSLGIGAREVEVGAFADNGVPNLGDVMISHSVGKAASIGPPDEVVVGVAADADIERVRRTLDRTLGAKIVAVRGLQSKSTTPIEEPDPVGTAEGDLIGSMDFRILKNGYIEPDPTWVAANIARGSVPRLGPVTCHRALFPQLVAALEEIQREGLAKEIDPGDFGGCYVPRFIDRDPRRGLSAHAFGLAFDLNVSRNHLGTAGDMDPRLVAIFERWGFAWGGRWSRPDPMHFELARLIDI